MKKKILLATALWLLNFSLSAQTTVNITLNKTDFCLGDSLVATISFSRPSNAYYTGFYGITGNIISGYSDYSQYNISNASNGTIIVSKLYLTSNDSIFKITVGDSVTAGTIEKKYTQNYKVHNKPTAYFRYLNPKIQCENRGMHFNLFSFIDSSICQPGSFIAKWYWYYGDGNADAPGSLATNHSYNYNFSGDSANEHTVSLKVTDIFGCSDSTWQSGFSIHPVPVAKPTLSNASAQCEKENQFNFIDSSFFFANTSESLFRKWTFTATDSTFNKTGSKHYSQAGTYRVKLVSYTLFGCGDTSSLFVTVKPAPEALNISGQQNVVAWSAHTYSIPYTSGSTYNWSADNGIVSSGAGSNSVTIQWNNASSGTVKVKETNADGCTGDSSVLTVLINPNSIENNITHQTVFAYPNPVANKLVIHNPGNVSAEINVYNIHGAIQLKELINGNSKTEWTVSEWKEGVYLLAAMIGEKSFIQKIVVMH